MADADGALPRRIAWVTGGSRGVGRGVAVALGQAGWVVYVTARSSADGRTGHLPGTVEEAAEAVTAGGGGRPAGPRGARGGAGGRGGGRGGRVGGRWAGAGGYDATGAGVTRRTGG